jgi:hypothetical protein
LQTKIINNTETNAYIVETFTECLFSAAIPESNGNVGLQVKVVDMGRCRFFNSVSVFSILFGMFSKSVRFSVSVFLIPRYRYGFSVFF